MPNLNTRRFTAPDVLSKIRRESLLQWLAPASDYLAVRGVVLPSAESSDPVDCEKLASVFFDPDEAMPEYLVNSLSIIAEMADQHGMDAILDAQAVHGLKLDVGDSPDPVDVAVQTYLEKPDVLQQLHNQHQLIRPRSFEYFVTSGDVPPAFVLPTPEHLRALECRLDEWYVKRKRGSGCRVFMYPKGNECWFLVRHGLPCKREAAIKDGEPTSVFYRPQKHDVVVYDIEHGELRVHGCGQRELEEFRREFGMMLFSDDEAFPGFAKYTIAPLVEHGVRSLVCTDVPGIESVALKEVMFRFWGQPGHEVWHVSEDLFAVAEQGFLHWPKIECVKRATFEVKFADSKKSRRLTILPSNRAQYGRDDDSVLIEQWLKARGFIREASANEGADDDVAVA
jgi:hypothetical protein